MVMAHRRKNPHPVCKQKRISSVVDRVLAAKLKVHHHDQVPQNGFSNEAICNYDEGSDTSEGFQIQSIAEESKNNENGQNIEIPGDLLEEFKALQKATNLNPTTLMRELIMGYPSLSSHGKTNDDHRPTRCDVPIQNLHESVKNERHDRGNGQLDHVVEERRAPEELLSQTDAHNAMQALKPNGKRAKLYKTNGKTKNEKEQMKLIAENMSNLGVYTSVMKLTRIKRTRKLKNVTVKNPHMEINESAHLQNTCVRTQGKENQLKCKEMETWDMKINFQEGQDVKTPIFNANTSLPQQPYMLVPVSTISSAENSSLKASHGDQLSLVSSPSMNNSHNDSLIESSRKRGIPSNAPVLTEPLYNAETRSRLNFPVTTFIPHLTPCYQPAIVLNVSNLVNTSSNTLDTHTATVSQSKNNEPQQGKTQQSGNDNNNIHMVSSASTQPTFLHHIVKPMNASFDTNKNNTPERNVSETLLQSGTSLAHKQLTLTTTSISSIQSGATFQKMKLSSKPTEKVRPRKRQSTTDVLSAMSTPANEFICTSFKLKNMNKPPKEKKKLPSVPGMKRRGRPPKKLFEMLESGLNPENFRSADIQYFKTDYESNSPLVSPHISNITDGNGEYMYSKNDSCKICDVTIQKHEICRLSHFRIKHCCNQCGLVRCANVPRQIVTGNEHIDKILKCTDCAQSDTTTSVSVLCSRCDERFHEFAEYIGHKQNTHYNGTGVFCIDCDKTFNFQKSKDNVEASQALLYSLDDRMDMFHEY